MPPRGSESIVLSLNKQEVCMTTEQLLQDLYKLAQKTQTNPKKQSKNDA